ncbi:hypothetical protein G5714_000178 [Onychostoma macrolepis]|uniref:Integrase core domain-containing protein n=1 Tax=Onychostoma macrolepis TaxID=369639 RepID=A0A7J6DFT3_9TELE|nr:hypothetical protein G5714_000178 [Onychostoma macrolepis]
MKNTQAFGVGQAVGAFGEVCGGSPRGVSRGDATGPTFGRKLMTGYLSANGIRAGEGRVGQLLRTIQQPYHEARCHGARNLNPVPYTAECMGHKLHIDQNEKLAMFGATHVLAIDGFSRKIVSFSSMPIKNNLLIYEDVYRSAVVNHGMWEQVRVDHGKEFYLSLFIQEMIEGYRNRPERQPYMQTQSTKNHTVERMWPEINNRVNYPLKTALVELVDQELLDMEDNLVRYCVSSFTCQLCHLGISRVVQAWNEHRIPGKGIPNVLAEGGCLKKISEELLPHANEAAELYEAELGSSLTRHSVFGRDPFSSGRQRACVEHHFAELHPDIEICYNKTVNGDFSYFKLALLDLIETTKRYTT